MCSPFRTIEHLCYGCASTMHPDCDMHLPAICHSVKHVSWVVACSLGCCLVTAPACHVGVHQVAALESMIAEGLACAEHLMCSVANYVERAISVPIGNLKQSFPTDFKDFTWDGRDDDKIEAMLQIKTSDVMGASKALTQSIASFEASGAGGPQMEGTLLAARVKSMSGEGQDLITLSHLFVATHGAFYLISNAPKYGKDKLDPRRKKYISLIEPNGKRKDTLKDLPASLVSEVQALVPGRKK